MTAPPNTLSAPEFQQEVLLNSEDIFRRLLKEIQNAKSQILVASAWFTDPELFDVLLVKTTEVNVRIIVNDNEDNKKLPFHKIVQKGGAVYKVKTAGRGQMHHKFCIVDEQMAIHGSYNWTLNARNNNQESVIATNHTETVHRLLNEFLEMEKNATALKAPFHWLRVFPGKDGKTPLVPEMAAPAISEPDTAPEPAQPDEAAEKPQPPKNHQADYEFVLSQMINAEVASFDRQMLREQGCERSKANNGDPQVLSNAMDSLYSLFINDINVVEDKKKRLIGKIQEQRTLHSASLKQHSDSRKRKFTADTEAAVQEKQTLVSALKTKLAINQSDIAAKQREDIPTIEARTQSLNSAIDELEQEMVQPKFRWYEYGPLLTLAIGLLLYLVFFYFSAAYILFFSEADTLTALKAGVPVEPVEIFDAGAFSKLWSKGLFAFLFAFVFTFLPLCTVVIGRIIRIKSAFWTITLTLGLALIIDAGIAYKIAESLYMIDALTNTGINEWKPLMALESANFWLVFVLGTLGLVLLKFLFEKLTGMSEERNVDTLKELRLVKKQQLHDQLADCQQSISRVKSVIENLKCENLKLQHEITTTELALASVPKKMASETEAIDMDCCDQISALEATTAIYIARIENDNMPISVTSMRDRMNVFLEGWNDYLHAHYAVTVAEEKSKAAHQEAGNWLAHKIAGNILDTRIATH